MKHGLFCAVLEWIALMDVNFVSLFLQTKTRSSDSTESTVLEKGKKQVSSFMFAMRFSDQDKFPPEAFCSADSLSERLSQV